MATHYPLLEDTAIKHLFISGSNLTLNVEKASDAISKFATWIFSKNFRKMLDSSSCLHTNCVSTTADVHRYLEPAITHLATFSSLTQSRSIVPQFSAIAGSSYLRTKFTIVSRETRLGFLQHNLAARTLRTASQQCRCVSTHTVHLVTSHLHLLI